MPYLIRTINKQLILLNDSSKNGLYSQVLSSTGPSRPMVINRYYPCEYSALIDHHQDLHIVTQSSPEQIIHLHYKNNNLLRQVLLEDPKGIYHFSNFCMVHGKDQVHLFYTAKEPLGNEYQLIHHILCEENKIEPCPILSFPSENLKFSLVTHDDTIFLLYHEIKTQHLIQLMTYQEGQWSKPTTTTSSSFPIEDFNFTINQNSHIHLVYVQEKYGRYHLIYKKHHNNIWSDEVSIYTTAVSLEPCIFTYQQGLWINFVDGGNLEMILSTDNGSTFSKPVPCSLQTDDLQRCHFVSAPNALPASFSCNMVYATLSQPVRIAILSNIDMMALHPDIKPNTELELFLDGAFHLASKQSAPASNVPASSPNLATLEAENQELKQNQEHLISQYNDMAELAKKIQEEGKKWRNKALDLSKGKDEGDI